MSKRKVIIIIVALLLFILATVLIFFKPIILVKKVNIHDSDEYHCTYITTFAHKEQALSAKLNVIFPNPKHIEVIASSHCPLFDRTDYFPYEPFDM